MKRRVLFLDRDGTINVEKDYVYRIGDFEFIAGTVELIKTYYKQDYLIFIITNQTGIAKKYYTKNDYKILTK